eukprot:6205748-Pleurochrysis_carterae.AAC.3
MKRVLNGESSERGLGQRQPASRHTDLKYSSTPFLIYSSVIWIACSASSWRLRTATGVTQTGTGPEQNSGIMVGTMHRPRPRTHCGRGSLSG